MQGQEPTKEQLYREATRLGVKGPLQNKQGAAEELQLIDIIWTPLLSFLAGFVWRRLSERL